MTRLLLALFAVLYWTSAQSQINLRSLEELGSDIGIQVFNQVVKTKPHDNVVISPHGIASVLGMLQLGADGKTKKQLTTAMRYKVNGLFCFLFSFSLFFNCYLDYNNFCIYSSLWQSWSCVWTCQILQIK